jgi:hypothetical protein
MCLWVWVDKARADEWSLLFHSLGGVWLSPWLDYHLLFPDACVVSEMVCAVPTLGVWGASGAVSGCGVARTVGAVPGGWGVYACGASAWRHWCSDLTRYAPMVAARPIGRCLPYIALPLPRSLSPSLSVSVTISLCVYAFSLSLPLCPLVCLAVWHICLSLHLLHCPFDWTFTTLYTHWLYSSTATSTTTPPPITIASADPPSTGHCDCLSGCVRVHLPLYLSACIISVPLSLHLSHTLPSSGISSLCLLSVYLAVPMPAFSVPTHGLCSPSSTTTLSNSSLCWSCWQFRGTQVCLSPPWCCQLCRRSLFVRGVWACLSPPWCSWLRSGCLAVMLSSVFCHLGYSYRISV